MKKLNIISSCTAGVFLLLMGAVAMPAQAQKGTLSLIAEDEAKSVGQISRADLRQLLADKINIRYTGDKAVAVDVALAAIVFKNGKVEEVYVSSEVVGMKQGDQKKPIGVPETDWFPEGGAALNIQEWGESPWWPWNWGSHPLDDDGPSGKDCSMTSTDYTGCTAAECMLLPPNSRQRSACLSASPALVALGDAANVPTAGTVVVLSPVPTGSGEGKGDVGVRGLILLIK